MKFLIIFIVSIYSFFMFAYAQDNTESQVKHLNILLTTADGKKFISKNKGYSWKHFDNNKTIIKLIKSNGNEYLSFDKGYSWKNLGINNNSENDYLSLMNKIVDNNIIINKSNNIISGDLNIICYDIMGNLIFEKEISTNSYSNNLTINVSSLKSGNYFLLFTNKYKREVLYFIKL